MRLSLASMGWLPGVVPSAGRREAASARSRVGQW
jgi:hypothetical protein